MKPGLRIDSLRIEGFGHFSRFTRELGPGLHLLYGPNEAGKSTLLAFLRSVLFGFEERGQPERYEPEGGGAFGGELRLTTAEGPLCVRRVGGRKSKGELVLLGPDGVQQPESRLRDALAHVPRELFFEVFAFRLDELSSFQRLTEQRGVSEALFAAGMQGARRLPEALERLRKDAEGLYKPGGQKPELNRVLKELEEVQARLRLEGDRPARYFEKKERLAALAEEQRGLEAEVRAAGHELERLSRLEAALGDVAALAEARAELATLPELDTFPEGGEARLEDALRRRREYRGEGTRLAERLSTVVAELERLSAPSPVREREEALRLALAAYSERAEAMRALPSRRAALAAKRRQVEGALEELGLAVDGPGLLALDLSAGARAGLEALASRLEAVDAAWREAGGTLGRARAERERLDGMVARLDAELAGLPNVRPAQVRQQQAALARVRGLRSDVERLGEQREELRRQWEGVRGGGEPPLAQAVLPGWWVAVAGVVAGVLAAVAWWQAGPVVAAVCLAGGLLLTGFLEGARRRVEAAHRAGLDAHAARQRGRQQEEERLRASLAALAAREQVLHRELLAASAEAGLGPVTTWADLAAREAALAEALEGAGRREVLQREREKLHAEREEAAGEEQRAGAAVREAEAKHEALGAELQEHLSARRLPPGLPAAAALTLWRDAAALRQRLQDVAADEAALAVDEKACAQVTSRLWAEASAAGLSSGTVEAVAARVASALETLRQQESRRLALEASHQELLAEKARLDGLIHEEELSLTLLLDDGGGGDEESFRRRAAQARRYAELTARARELSQRIEARTGLTEAQARDALREAGGEEGLRAALESRRARHTEAQERQKAALTEQGAIRHQLEAWENDGLLAQLRIQEESLRAKAAELATRYAADRLALALLGRARRRFEEEQQPRVVQLASEHFAELTGGRYRRVFIPAAKERELRVGDGQRDWSAAQLSRGTREQLYLAFRLAVVRDFAETRGALPLITDDVLVNFDPVRARGAIHLLARLSEQQQVIAFTCHPWLREAFQAEGARVQELMDTDEGSAHLPASALQAG